MQVTKKQSAKNQARRCSIKTFIKVVNYQHMMPTRYSLDIDLKAVATLDTTIADAVYPNKTERKANPTKKIVANRECKKLMEERFKTGKNRWFFTKLRF